MGYIPDDCEVNFNFDIVDYSDFNIEPPTPPPLPPYPLTSLPLSLPPSPEPIFVKSDFDDVPMEVNFNFKNQVR